MACKQLILIVVASILCNSGTSALREDECVEVGFARASFVLVEQGYNTAKEKLTSKWDTEDKEGKPTYGSMNLQMKNVTRAAQLLEETSKEVLGKIRKTRVGKRCQEEYLLVGVEKHVTPLIQLDKELAEDLGLVMSFRCLVGSPYPNVDGTCIHEEGPDMGGVGSKFLRLIPPVSGKGGFSLRSSRSADKSLPSAREVSRLIRRHNKRPAVSSLFAEWGHFIARDTFSIPESPWTEGINCCEETDHIDCNSITIAKEDNTLFASSKCINFRRSAPAQAILGHREAFSAVSTYLDATPVYGSTNEAAFEKKTSYFGYLKSPEPNEDLEKKKKKCPFPVSFKGCFDLDSSVDYIEDLDLLLTLEHNSIADALAVINPHFDDALLYNEARRISIAQYNNILYGQYLPVLLGKDTVEKHSLLPGSGGPGAAFIPEVNPGILTSFALATYWNPSMASEWRKEWGSTHLLDSLHYDSIREDMYQDLLTIDVQRGRDHGLPSYDTWRRFCDEGRNIEKWSDYENTLSKEIIEDLKELYQDEIGDLDLMISLLETPEEGAVVGKTTICVLADQFARLRTGNRLYWEHETSMLTGEQQNAIKNTSAANILCRHLSIASVPTNPFIPVSESNPAVECSELPDFDLSTWKDTSLIEVMKKEKEEKNSKKTEDDEHEIEDEKEKDIKHPAEDQPEEVVQTEGKTVHEGTKKTLTKQTVMVNMDGKSEEQGHTNVPDKIQKSEL